MKKQPEVTAKTKEALVSAFCSLYAEKPIDKITIKEITGLARYNRSTFYQYFTDIYDLLEYVENDLLETIKKSWHGGNDALFSPDLNLLIKLFLSKEIHLKAVLSDYGSFHFTDRLKKELSLDNLAGVSPSSERLTNYLIEFHLSTSMSMLRVWFKKGKDLSSEDLLKLIHALYTKGVSVFHEPAGPHSQS